MFVVLAAGITLVLLMTHGIDRLAGQFLYFHFIEPGVSLVCLLWMLVASIRKPSEHVSAFQCCWRWLALLRFRALCREMSRPCGPPSGGLSGRGSIKPKSWRRRTQRIRNSSTLYGRPGDSPKPVSMSLMSFLISTIPLRTLRDRKRQGGLAGFHAKGPA